MSDVMFKTRSRKTGEFSKGGAWPSFGKQGKVWTRRGDISSHFSQLHALGRDRYREHDVEVVELHVVEVAVTSGNDWINAAEQRVADKQAARQRAVQSYREQQERAQLKELVKKYGVPK